MAEPGKETAAALPPPPQETVPQAPAAVAEPSLQTDTPISASQDTEIPADGAAVLDSAQPEAESAHQPPPLPPPQEAVAVAAVGGAPEQTTTEAEGQPPVAAMPQKVAALPPPAETPAQESAAPAAPTPASGLEEEKKPTAGAMPPPQKDSGSAVRVPSMPEAANGEGETKPAALDGKRPEPGQEQVATLPPPPETTAVAAELAAPVAAQQPPREQEDGAPEQAPSVPEEKDTAPAAARPQEGEEKPARRRWRWLQAVVSLLFLRPKGGETKPPPPGAMAPLPVDSVGKSAVDEVMKTSAQEQDGKKPPASGHQEQKPAAKKKPSQKSTPTPPQLQGEQPSAALKKFRKAGRLVQFIVALAKKKKPETASSGPGGEEEGSEAKPEEKEPAPAPVLEEKEPAPPVLEEKEAAPVLEEKEETKTTQHRQEQQQWHENWRREEEVRLEDILEEAFTRLIAAEYIKELRGVRKKCLLTFSVFDLASEVKKQAMIYWWVAEFNLRHRTDPQPAAGSSRDDDDDDAERIFLKLADHGFLVPIKNWCSKVIHGCQVNPLVHWMLKRQARGDGFAELDDRGSPKKLQLSSSILCLTSGNRTVMQKMRMRDDAPPLVVTQAKTAAGRRSSKKVTKEPSSLQSKSNDVQDQQQLTTKDEAQVGSKSIKDQEETTQDNKDQLAKDQQQPTTKGEAQVGSNSTAVVDKAPSQKDEDPIQAKDKITKGPQNIKPGSALDHVDDIPQLFQGKRVILNVNAHVYPISRSALLPLAECLVVLQLGRWNNIDDKTYMEVDGLESLDAIGLLKNLRYLGLRGLSRLTELPKGIENLKKLIILDMRGCQNLVKVEASDSFIKQKFHKKQSAITELKQLTHLDLTECYMLEHIGRGITSLTELQVFKGFVFASGTQVSKACRIQDLKRLKKLQKLTVSISTDAYVAAGEMAGLKDLTSLRKLTITWSEIPSILEGDNKKVKRNELVERWTSFQLPKDLMKLDIRCYPKEELKLEHHEKLEKLYLRGGDMKSFSTEKSKTIKTLRLRYLEKFTMDWNDIRSELQNIEYLEIAKLKMVPVFTLDLDRNGIWTKDQKEEDNKRFLAPNEDAMGNNKASEPSGSTEDSSTN